MTNDDQNDDLDRLRGQLAAHTETGDTEAAAKVRDRLDQLARPPRETAVRPPREHR